MKKDVSVYIEHAARLSGSSAQTRDVNKLAGILMIEDTLEEILDELRKMQKTTAQKPQRKDAAKA